MQYYLLAAVFLFALSCQPKEDTSGQESTRQPSTDLHPAAEPVPDTVTVEAKDHVFLPPQLQVVAGQAVLIKVINNGSHEHSLQLLLDDDTVSLDKPIPINGTGLLEFTAPRQPGNYRFYCPMRNDSMLGMKGELIVSPGEK